MVVTPIIFVDLCGGIQRTEVSLLTIPVPSHTSSSTCTQYMPRVREFVLSSVSKRVVQNVHVVKQ